MRYHLLDPCWRVTQSVRESVVFGQPLHFQYCQHCCQDYCQDCCQDCFQDCCQDWLSRLVVNVACQDWLSRLLSRLVSSVAHLECQFLIFNLVDVVERIILEEL